MRMRVIACATFIAGTLPTPHGPVLASQPVPTNERPAEPAPKSSPTQRDSGKAKDEHTDSLAAQDLLKACAARYGKAKAYSDIGTWTVESTRGGATETETVSFSTAFERDGRFVWRCTYPASVGSKQQIDSIVWSSEQKQWNCRATGEPQPAPFEDLQTATQKIVASTSGLPRVILPMLQMRGTPTTGAEYFKLARPVIKGKEQVDGVECTRVGGSCEAYPEGASVATLWIDAQFFVRRVENVLIIRDPGAAGGKQPSPAAITVAKRTLTVKPEIDKPIDGKVFEQTAAASQK